jgi:arylsulfatase A-like enzyme
MRILYIDIDTLRPDHLGCYGYHRNTSPNIDRIAARGIRFENCYCSDAPCLPSRAALMTGRFGIHTGVVGHGGTTADIRLQGAQRGFTDRLSQQSLWAMLKQAGLTTATISPFAERHSAWFFYAGLTEIYDTGKRGSESAEHVTPTALDWIERNSAQDNWFLHVNYWDPHTPYRAPEAFGNPFDGQAIPEWLNEEVLTRHRGMVGPHGPREMNMYDARCDDRYPRFLGEVRDMNDLRMLIDGYDCGIAYADQHVGKLLGALEDKGVLDDLVIIVSSDHGENLGELGIYSEHATADYITTRIPLIVCWPGRPAGHADTGLHYNLDLGPTLVELLDRPVPETWDGRSFAKAITDREDCGRDCLVLSQCAHVAQRGVRFGNWMYMRTWDDGYHLFPDEMLFDIQSDPHEQDNLAEPQPDVCKQGAEHLQQWHDEMMKTQLDGYDRDPMQTVLAEGGPFHARGRLEEYCKRLEATERGWAINELRRRHPGEFR